MAPLEYECGRMTGCSTEFIGRAHRAIVRFPHASAEAPSDAFDRIEPCWGWVRGL